jgi:glycerophosphoryl diester phosphodiesterase
LRPFQKPWVIAHRGASGLLPEHTLAGYALAIEQGADVIEPDLVASADGVLYARHDLGLARSTDIAARLEFAHRRRRGVDGSEDCWIDDLSSAEVDTLRAIQPWPARPHHRDGVFRIPRFVDVLELLSRERGRRERPLLVYPELKHPTHFLQLGIDVVDLLVRDLAATGMTGPDAPVLVQCFDRDCLDRVRTRTSLRVVQLSIDLPDLGGSPVDGYGISKQALMAAGGAAWVAAAHRLGRFVHAWTFRDDQPQADRSPVDECAGAFALGCDGLFCDFPATGLTARAAVSSGLQRVASLGVEILQEGPA